MGDILFSRRVWASLFCSPSEGRPSMADYRSIIAWAVSQLPRTADEARHAVYEQARTALHERLGNDPQISDTELVNEHHRLEVAIYEVEEDLLLREMRRFVREEMNFISKIKELDRRFFVRLRGAGRDHATGKAWEFSQSVFLPVAADL